VALKHSRIAPRGARTRRAFLVKVPIAAATWVRASTSDFKVMLEVLAAVSGGADYNSP